jgi:hypothetical protein
MRDETKQHIGVLIALALTFGLIFALAFPARPAHAFSDNCSDSPPVNGKLLGKEDWSTSWEKTVFWLCCSSTTTCGNFDLKNNSSMLDELYISVENAAGCLAGWTVDLRAKNEPTSAVFAVLGQLTAAAPALVVQDPRTRYIEAVVTASSCSSGIDVRIDMWRRDP